MKRRKFFLALKIFCVAGFVFEIFTTAPEDKFRIFMRGVTIVLFTIFSIEDIAQLKNAKR